MSSKLASVLDDLGGDRCSTSCADPCKKHQLLNIANLKAGDNAVAFSNRATTPLDLSERQRNRLIRFFESTLAKDPDRRDGDLEHLSSLLTVDG